MLMTLMKAIKRNQEPYFKVARNLKEVISIERIYDNGIFEHPNKVFSASFMFTDVNYAVVGEKEKETIFQGYCDLINIFPMDAVTKITINNRKIDLNEVKKTLCIPMREDDNLNEYRAEYNQMLVQAIADRNAIVQEKYITVSKDFKSYTEAYTYFKSVRDELNVRLNSVKSTCRMLDTNERLKILHDFYRSCERSSFSFEPDIARALNQSFKDYISPDYMDLSDSTCVQLMNHRFSRVLYLKTYANRFRDDIVAKLTAVNKEMMLSIDIIPIPTEEAVADADNKLLGIETNITRWQARQNKNYNFSATVPQDYQKKQRNVRDILTEITDYDQKEFQCILTIVLTASTKDELDRQTDEITSIASQTTAQLATCRWEQAEGLNTALPIGVSKIPVYRTLLTESLAVFMPFMVQNVDHERGSYYGQNQESGSLIKIDRLMFQNGNAMIFGVPGSGKSFRAKMEMISYILRGDCDVIVVDPQGEYGRLFKALGGEIIKFSPSSPTTVNLMDINADYKEEDGSPVALKSDFMIAFCEQACEGMILSPIHRSLIIRVTEQVYREYIANDYQGECPTLYNFVDIMRAQPEDEAAELALALEMYTNTSFSMFAKPTNVNTENRLLCYDIHSIGSSLKPAGMLIMLDAIFNRVTANAKRGRMTYIFFDEFHLLTRSTFTADYLQILWRTLRKFKAFCTGITQNISEMADNPVAASIISNSEIIVLLRQAPDDRDKVRSLLRFPQELISYVTNAPEGSGLVKVGDTVMPFSNRFPENTDLYKLMTTKAADLLAFESEKKAKKEED